MPQQITPETRQRYIRALEMREAGSTFSEIATTLGYADAGTARYAWIGGLRIAGRANEIPIRTPRTVRVTINNAIHALTVAQLESFTITSDITFGIEIECIGLNTSAATQALRTAGVQCVDEGYDHTTRSTWKVVPDGSLTGRGGTCEVVSPILRGTDGLTEVRTVMSILRAAGAKVNESCGMHIHIGAEALTQEHQVRMIIAYGKWQGAFTGWIRERRINGRWARIRTAQSWAHLADRWGTTSDRRIFAHSLDRLYAFNAAAYHRHGTFEMRAHHGSLNGTNACAWIALHIAFAEACRMRLGFDTFAHNTNTATHGAAYWDANNDPAPREECIESSKALIATIAGMTNSNGEPLLHPDAAEYLLQRAGNIPSSRSANA